MNDVQVTAPQRIGRIRQRAERYATPLRTLVEDVDVLAARVDEHLKRMGATWN